MCYKGKKLFENKRQHNNGAYKHLFTELIDEQQYGGEMVIIRLELIYVSNYRICLRLSIIRRCFQSTIYGIFTNDSIVLSILLLQSTTCVL